MGSITISITLTDGAVTVAQIRDALMVRWGYTGDMSDPVAKATFAKAYVVNWIKSEYINSQVDAANAQAQIAIAKASTDAQSASIQ